jgi:hypothetical protein
MYSRDSKSALKKAAFFVGQAKSCQGENPQLESLYIEVSIIFCRSAMSLLLRNLCSLKNFENWKKGSIFHDFSQSQLHIFLKNTRDFVLHEGQISLDRVINVSISVENIVVADLVNVGIVRGDNFFERPAKILWEDLIKSIKFLVGKFIKNIRIFSEKFNKTRSSLEVTSDALYFSDDWKSKPAVEWLDEYISAIQVVIDDADQLFK